MVASAIKAPVAAPEAAPCIVTDGKPTPRGLSPLDHMLQVLRDTAQPDERRDKMAVNAAPYDHAKLAALTVAGDQDKPLRLEDAAGARRWLEERLAGVAARIAPSGGEPELGGK
jgi:hypothetical protein